MNISQIFYDGLFGHIAAQALARLQDQAPRVTRCDAGRIADTIDDAEHGEVAIFLGRPAIGEIVAIGSRLRDTPWIASFPFERYIVVSSPFRKGLCCPSCFTKRWISQPPRGIQGETALAIATLWRESPTVEYRNNSPLAPLLAAQLMARSLETGTASSVCFDLGSSTLDSAVTRPLHGCGCRGTATTEDASKRFTRFDEPFLQIVSNVSIRHGDRTK